MQAKYKLLLSLLAMASLALSCMAIATKRAEKHPTTAQQWAADTVPPILSQKRISENGVDYIIDTTRCHLSPEQFIQRYPKWLGLGKHDTLKIDTLSTKHIAKDPQHYNGLEWSYSYRHFFKGVPVGGRLNLRTGNNIVAYVGNWLNPVPDTIDVSVNFTPRQVQDMIAELLRKEEGVDSVAISGYWKPKGSTYVTYGNSIAVVGKAGLGMYAKCNDAAEQAKRWHMKIGQTSERRLDNPALTQDGVGIGQATYYGNATYNAVVSSSNPTYIAYLPYYRAGVIGYWFYLATEGSTEAVGGINDICGLGINTMTNVLFATLEKCRAENGVGDDAGFTPTFEQFCQKSIDAIAEMSVPETEKCQIRKCVLKAWKAVGLGLSIPSGRTDQTQDETLCFVDLRLRDNTWDTGEQPNYSACLDSDGNGWTAASLDDWEDIWASPDIWVCPDNDTCKPDDSDTPTETQYNQIGFMIHNAHPDLVSDPAQLHLYYK